MINKGLTWDLDQKMKTSPTILKSSSASGSGFVNHLALHFKRKKFPYIANWSSNNMFNDSKSLRRSRSKEIFMNTITAI